MAEDDEGARASRADKLRERISRLKEGGDEGESSEPEGEKHGAGKSPREFVHERMRELDEEEKEAGGS